MAIQRQALQNVSSDVDALLALIASGMLGKQYDAAMTNARRELTQPVIPRDVATMASNVGAMGEIPVSRPAMSFDASMSSGPMNVAPRPATIPDQNPELMAILARMLSQNPQIARNPNFGTDFQVAQVMAPKFQTVPQGSAYGTVKPGGEFVPGGIVPKQEAPREDWRAVMLPTGEGDTVRVGERKYGKEQLYLNGQPTDQFRPSTRDADVATSNAAVRTPYDSREDLLKRAPRAHVELLRKVANYEMDPSKITSLRGNKREEFMQDLALYDPSYDVSKFGAYQQLRKEFGTGLTSRNIKSLNTVVDHLNSLKKAGDQLANGNVQLWNRIRQFGLTQVKGDPRVNAFNAAKEAVASELATVFKNTGVPTDQEIKVWENTLSSVQSPQQIKAVIDKAVELMGGRFNAIEHQWTAAGGKLGGYPILSEKAANILERMGYHDWGNSTDSNGDIEIIGVQ